MPATARLRDRSRRRLTPIRIRRSQYLNDRIEQDQRRIRRRIRSMLGFKSQMSAAIVLSGIEMIRMMRKRPARYACNPSPSIAEPIFSPPDGRAEADLQDLMSTFATQPFRKRNRCSGMSRKPQLSILSSERTSAH